MKIRSFLFLSLAALAFAACSDDETKGNDVSVAFSVPSMNLTEADTDVQVLFSEPAPENGTVTISFTTTGVAYGTDFITDPAATGSTFDLSFEKGATAVGFAFNKLIDAVEGQTKNVVFKIEEVSFGTLIGANGTVQLNFNETPSLGQALAAATGGPNQPNGVFVDLSSGMMTGKARNSWDLGFYAGSEFRVILNNSVKMSAKALATTNIDEVQFMDESMLIGQGAGFANQVDTPAGNIDGTAIAAISATDAENFVYLVNLGNNPSETAPAVGSEGTVGGAHRGWKKIRILKSGNDYKLQYADIASTTHQEVTITKNSAYNFTFFSLLNNAPVEVEPQKNQWDICFTAFINLVNFGGGMVPYHYPDYVTTNVRGGAQSYQVMVAGDVTYANFTKAQVVNGNFNADQRNIGSNWRSTSAGNPPVSQFVLRTDRFYVIKDAAGNLYKLRFTGGANQAGERGYPTFEYALLP